MIYKLTFDDGRIDFLTAKSQLHLLQQYDKEFDLPLQEIESLDEISDEEAKKIMILNPDYEEEENDPNEPAEVSLFDLAISDEFSMIASTEWD